MQENRVKKIDIDAVLKSKSPKASRWIPRFLVNYLKRIVHQNDMNDFLEKHGHLYGIEFTQAIIDYMHISYKVDGLENIALDKRYIFASNHPLGGLDGVVMMNAIAKRFNEIKFPVNDILMNLENLKPLFLPINKHGSQSQQAARLLEDAYQSNIQILMFPAGLVSRKNGKIIKDLEWKKSFVKKAIEHKRDVVPVYIDGKNSKFFYNLAYWRKKLGIKINIEMLYLVDELYKQKGTTLTIRFGTPIGWEELKNGGNPQKMAAKIKERVYEMGSN